MFKRGEKIELEIEEVTSKGDGWASIDGIEFVVRGAVPGDRVQATIRRKRGGIREAIVDSILNSQLVRIAPRCPHFGICGGCRWQDIQYKDQLGLKERMVNNALRECGLRGYEQRPIIASRESFYYRNKMEFSFGQDSEGDLQLGLHLRGRYNRVFDVFDCQLQSHCSNRIVKSVRNHAIELGLSVYNLKSHKGLLRFLVIREGKATDEVMVNLVVSDYPNSDVDEVVRRVVEEIREITTFLVTLHTGKAQTAVGEREFVVKGTGSIFEKCGGVHYGISSNSFFQTNTYQASVLYGLISDITSNLTLQTVLDLYCGTGGISLHLAKNAGQVVGVEQIVEAVDDARGNACRNDVTNCTFIAEQAETAVDIMLDRGMQFDLVVADPPRVGMHKSVLEALGKANAPVILYVSCNPQSLGVDVKKLCETGYKLNFIQPMDLFPQTPHCEAVAQLSRIK